MAAWDDLVRLGVVVRPLAGELPRPGNRYSPFSATWGTTLRTLAAELRYLDAKRVALGLDVQDRDIRLDGLPRANARIGNPTVELAFESRHGPLRYATCEFTGWQDNVRAIALSMEALRKVDRYGVSKHGEQYRGWRALPSGSDDSFGLHDTATARAWIADTYGTMTAAIKATHPDQGGAVEDFRKVMRAKELMT